MNRKRFGKELYTFDSELDDKELNPPTKIPKEVFYEATTTTTLCNSKREYQGKTI